MSGRAATGYRAGRVATRTPITIETTIAQTNDFKVLRPPHDNPKGKLAWKPLRKGVADLHRRAEVSQRSNERYLDALAAVDEPTPCSRLFDAVALRDRHGGKTRLPELSMGMSGDFETAIEEGATCVRIGSLLFEGLGEPGTSVPG